MTKEDLIFELKKRCSFWLNNKTISKKHALECLFGILENEESRPSLPSNLDEAAHSYAWKKQENHIDFDGDEYLDYGPRYDAFKAGAEWMAGQGETVAGIVTKVGDKLDVETTEYLIPEESEFERGDEVVIQIRKKQ